MREFEAERFHLEAAEGWLELGNWQEANEELERISPELRGRPEVLELRCDIYGEAGKWNLAAQVGKILSELEPWSPFGFVRWAYALHGFGATGRNVGLYYFILSGF